MYGAGIASYEGFSDTQVLLNVFIDNAFLLVVAVGMTFVILTGGIDLSVGAAVALTTMIVAELLKLGWPPAVVLLSAIGPALTFLGVTAYWERALHGVIILAAVAADALRARPSLGRAAAGAAP